MRRELAILGITGGFLMALTACSDDIKTNQPPGSTTSQGGSGGTPTTGGTGGTGGTDVGGNGGGGGTSYDCVDPPPANPQQLDLLLVVDNSRSMADKQAVLSDSVPRLVRYFTNPRCLDGDGAEVANQPAGPADACPSGSTREMTPITDLHIGVISTSIGGHGSDACVGNDEPSENDKAHLLSRSAPGDSAIDTYEALGFLAWDPTKSLSPEGTCSDDELSDTLGKMIRGAGEVGCGFEAQLESWYRFLIDPDPYDSIQMSNDVAVLAGTDQLLLKQRADFMRPDSVLVVVVVTDENDCSTRDGGQYFFANQIFAPGGNNPYHLPKPRAACAIDPNDPCCRSCGQIPGPGCDSNNDDCSGPLSGVHDSVNLRCFEQKRRFGIDFAWPLDRYQSGFNDSQIQDRFGNIVANPVFTGARTPNMVFLAGVLGVPWQDVARRDQNGKPDLIAGLNANNKPVGGLQSAAELSANGTWDVILGDVYAYVNATDPLMIESIDPRSGSNPITGDAIAAAGAGLLANPINGHEYTNSQKNDLQYACVFRLPAPRDCTDPSQVACDCVDPNNDNPLCQDDSGNFGTTQYYAKAYPARRELQLLKMLGAQGVVGSICPAKLGASNEADFGYHPTFTAIAEAVASAL